MAVLSRHASPDTYESTVATLDSRMFAGLGRSAIRICSLVLGCARVKPARAEVLRALSGIPDRSACGFRKTLKAALTLTWGRRR